MTEPSNPVEGIVNLTDLTYDQFLALADAVLTEPDLWDTSTFAEAVHAELRRRRPHGGKANVFRASDIDIGDE